MKVLSFITAIIILVFSGSVSSLEQGQVESANQTINQESKLKKVVPAKSISNNNDNAASLRASSQTSEVLEKPSKTEEIGSSHKLIHEKEPEISKVTDNRSILDSSIAASSEDNPSDKKQNENAEISEITTNKTSLDNSIAPSASNIQSETSQTEKNATPKVETNRNNVISNELNKELVSLTKSLSGLVERKEKGGFSWEGALDFFSKLVAIFVSIVGPYLTYLGLIQASPLERHKETIAKLAVIIGVVSCVYVFSGIVTSVLYAIIAFIVLLISLVVAFAFIIKFIDESLPEVKESLLSKFTQNGRDLKPRQLAKKCAISVANVLNTIADYQQIHGVPKLHFDNSFVEGFDKTILELLPHSSVTSHWTTIDNEVVVPVNINATVTDSSTGKAVKVININAGLVVVEDGKSLDYRKFDRDGLTEVANEMVKIQYQHITQMMNEQRSFQGTLENILAKNLVS